MRIAFWRKPALSEERRQALEEWVSMVAECGGVGDRWSRWREAVAVVLQALDAATPPGPIAQLLASLTPQQAARIAGALSAQQHDLLRQVISS